jgi:hypothetical protein
LLGGDRTERRDRLRQLGGQLLGSLTNPQGGGPLGAPLDFNKVNAALPGFFAPLLNGDLYIDALQIAFDPARTDLAKDTLRLTGDLGLRKSAWSTAPSHLHADLSATADLANPTGPRATATALVTVNTDVVALANLRLQKFKTQKQATPVGPPQSEKAIFQAKLADRLASAEPLTTFDDVVDLFQTINSLRFSAQNENIDRIKNALAATTDPAERDRLSAELVAARRGRDSLANTRLTIERDAMGRAVKVTVTGSNPDPLADPAVEQFQLAVTADSANASATVRLQKGMEVYALLKPVVITALDRLAQRDPTIWDAQRGMIRGFFDRARQAVVEGEF